MTFEKNSIVWFFDPFHNLQKGTVVDIFGPENFRYLSVEVSDYGHKSENWKQYGIQNIQASDCYLDKESCILANLKTKDDLIRFLYTHMTDTEKPYLSRDIKKAVLQKARKLGVILE